MLEWIKHIPNWLLVTLISLVAFVLVICLLVAVNDGRRVEIGPFTIYESASAEIAKLEHEVERLKTQLDNRPQTFNEQVVLAQLPASLNAQTLNEALTKIRNILALSQEQASHNTWLQSKLEQVEKVEGTFLYKLLIFNQDATCYGATLNFTAGKDREECLPKAQLAERFLEFLTEIDFYVATASPSPAEAKAQLLRLQEKYQFNTKGWYGPDVFKSIISEFYSKA